MLPSWNKCDRGIRACVVLCVLAVGAFAEPADWIYSARYVVTMDAQHRLIDDGAVAIRGERIVGVGKRADINRQFQAGHRLDRPEAILMPGLINTHTHAAMSLLRGIAVLAVGSLVEVRKLRRVRHALNYCDL